MKKRSFSLFLVTLVTLLAGCAAQPGPPQESERTPLAKSTGEAAPLVDFDDFVTIKGGSYLMGDLYGNDQYAKPVHKVTLNDFAIGRYEVTFAQYDRFCNDTRRPLPDDEGWGRDQRPVINVTHTDAVAYTTWLSNKTGRTFRLPSEAEWEYAARAGKSTNYWWGTQVGMGNANCLQCGSKWDGKQTAPVGSFKANPYGLYDVHGNVYEWVADSWHPNYQGAPADGSAWIAPDAEQYVSRGGSFLEIPISLYAFSRNWSAGDEPRRDIGFRIVMEP